MSITRKENGRWLVRWEEEGRHRGRTFSRLEDARRFEAERRRQTELGAHAAPEASPMRLGVWLETWFERGRIEWARSTQQHRAAILDKWIAPYLSGVRLRDLGEARVRRWRHDIHGDGCSPQQCNQALRVLSAALGAAVGDGHLPSNPCLRVKRLTVPKPRARVMTPDQIERLRVAMPSQRDRVLLGLLAYAGLRPEEALALRWIDVGRLLVIDRAFTHGEEKGTKTNQRRTVEIIKPLAADLEALRAGSGGEGLVAPSGTGGHLHLGNWRNRIWIPACARRSRGDALRLPTLVRVAAHPRGALAPGSCSRPRTRLRRDDLEALRPCLRGGSAGVIDAGGGRHPRRPLANRGPGPVARKLHGRGFEALGPLASEAGKATSCREKAKHARQDSDLPCKSALSLATG